jgi:hypothetical protein
MPLCGGNNSVQRKLVLLYVSGAIAGIFELPRLATGRLRPLRWIEADQHPTVAMAHAVKHHC